METQLREMIDTLKQLTSRQDQLIAVYEARIESQAEAIAELAEEVADYEELQCCHRKQMRQQKKRLGEVIAQQKRQLVEVTQASEERVRFIEDQECYIDLLETQLEDLRGNLGRFSLN